jgi:DNA-binding NarL/FixJ family response regulator
METYKCLLEGLSNREIAQKMKVTEAYVRYNLSSIYSSLGATLPGYFECNRSAHSRDRVKAVILGLLNGVASPDFPQVQFIERSRKGSQERRAR